MKLAFIGVGKVGAPLADRLQRAGHSVTIAQSKDGSASIAAALERNGALLTAPALEAVRAADVVFLATPFQANEAVLLTLREELAGKILVDCTNPVGPGLSHGLGSQQSGAAWIAQLVSGARVVKAFTIYGYENLEDNGYPAYAPLKPAMLFCGDDAAAKAAVAELIGQLGWEPVDVGGLVQALHLEHLTLLWIRLVRANGHSPQLVWGALRR